jgi:hypothetical protein
MVVMAVNQTTQTALRIVIITLSLGVAFLQSRLAEAQLTTVGFAASNRDPNLFLHDIGYALAFLSLANIVLALKSTLYAGIVLAFLIISLGVLYLLSWQ